MSSRDDYPGLAFIAAHPLDGSRDADEADRALHEIDALRDLLRRLSQWDHMQPPTADGPYWLGEIAKAIGRGRE